MSTKIYDAYRIDLRDEQLPIFANKVRDVMRPWLQHRYMQSLCRIAVNLYHTANLSDSALSKAFEIQKSLDLGTDDFSFVAYAIADDKYTYVTTYGGSPSKAAFLEEMSKLYSIEDYSYFDNSDIPENVTSEEWEKRRQKWEDLGLLSYYAPIELGVSVDMFNSRWRDEIFTMLSWGYMDIYHGESGTAEVTKLVEQMRDIIQETVKLYPTDKINADKPAPTLELLFTKGNES